MLGFALATIEDGMALKINLKAGDRLLMATSSVEVAGEGYTTLIINGTIPVLRASDAITLEQAVTPTQQFRYLIQQAYLSNDGELIRQARILAEQSHDLADRFLEVVALFEKGQAFKALREATAIDQGRTPS